MIADQWFIGCFDRELKKKQTIAKQIAGKEIVLFRTESGKVIALEDRCCHRNVHLSLGYVKGEQIKCGYHGWEYNSEGRCTHIPSLEAGRGIPSRARVNQFPVEAKHKIIWVYVGDPERQASASIPPFDELDKWPFIFNYHEVKGNLKLIAESLFDAQHINHVHRDSIDTMMGDLGNEVVDFHLETTVKSMKGWYYRSNGRSLFEKIYFGFAKQLETHFGFWFPHSSMLDLRFPAQLHFPARNMIIYEHFYEIDEEKCMMIQITTWKNIFRFNPWFAKWFMARKSNKIVEEDIEFLESNKHWHGRKQLKDHYVPADATTFAFNRIWETNIEHGAERPHSKAIK